jgi:hypothetical protein
MKLKTILHNLKNLIIGEAEKPIDIYKKIPKTKKIIKVKELNKIKKHCYFIKKLFKNSLKIDNKGDYKLKITCL